MMTQKPGAISDLDLKEIERVVAALKAVGQDASDLEQQIATARQLQVDCSHRGYVRTDGSIYLECGLCGAQL